MGPHSDYRLWPNFLPQFVPIPKNDGVVHALGVFNAGLWEMPALPSGRVSAPSSCAVRGPWYRPSTGTSGSTRTDRDWSQATPSAETLYQMPLGSWACRRSSGEDRGAGARSEEQQWP